MQGPMGYKVRKWGVTAYSSKTQPGGGPNIDRTVVKISTSRQIEGALKTAERSRPPHLLHLPGRLDTTHTAPLQCRRISPFLDNVAPKLYVTQHIDILTKGGCPVRLGWIAPHHRS